MWEKVHMPLVLLLREVRILIAVVVLHVAADGGEGNVGHLVVSNLWEPQTDIAGPPSQTTPAYTHEYAN